MWVGVEEGPPVDTGVEGCGSIWEWVGVWCGCGCGGGGGGCCWVAEALGGGVVPRAG